MNNPSRIESLDLFVVLLLFRALETVATIFMWCFSYGLQTCAKTSVNFFLRVTPISCTPYISSGTLPFYWVRKAEGIICFLITGLVVVFLELTLVNFAWFFNIQFSLVMLVVIWTLGVGMIVLAAFIHLPFKLVLATGILLIVGHHLFDDVHVQGAGLEAILWSLVHEQRGFPLSNGMFLFVGYPFDTVDWRNVYWILLLAYSTIRLMIQYAKKMLLYLGGGTGDPV